MRSQEGIATEPGKVCRFCGKSAAFVDCRIYPRAFVRDRSVPGKNNFLLSEGREFLPRSPTGVYDDSLVCAGCEVRFGVYDEYGHQFFQLAEVQPLIVEGQFAAWQSPVDYRKLKLFLLSVLWRASVSTRPECKGVTLGRFEEQIRGMIETGDAGSPRLFPVVLERYDVPERVPLTMPYRSRIDGVNTYKLQMAGCAAWVAIDERSIPQVLMPLSLDPGRPAYFLPKDYVGGHDWKMAIKMLGSVCKRTGPLPPF